MTARWRSGSDQKVLSVVVVGWRASERYVEGHGQQWHDMAWTSGTGTQCGQRIWLKMQTLNTDKNEILEVGQQGSAMKCRGTESPVPANTAHRVGLGVP